VVAGYKPRQFLLPAALFHTVTTGVVSVKEGSCPIRPSSRRPLPFLRRYAPPLRFLNLGPALLAEALGLGREAGPDAPLKLKAFSEGLCFRGLTN
jgi:hypothetical protein